MELDKDSTDVDILQCLDAIEWCDAIAIESINTSSRYVPEASLNVDELVQNTYDHVRKHQMLHCGLCMIKFTDETYVSSPSPYPHPHPHPQRHPETLTSTTTHDFIAITV